MTSTEVAGSLLGAAVKRREDPRLIRGQGTYLGNMHLDRECWMVAVRSHVAHGRVVSIEVDDATAMPGVIGVFTGKDIHGVMPIDFTDQPPATQSPLVVSDVVRFVGDIVAVVVAEEARQAADAADLVWVEIDPLSPIPTVETALADGATILFPELGTNVVAEGGLAPDPGVLDGADVVVRLTVRHQRVAAVPLETNSALAYWNGDHLEMWAGCQAVHAIRNAVATALGVDRKLIRVRVPDMGGGFGAKILTYREQVICAFLARKLGRPVRWNETRTENMVAMTHGRDQIHTVELGARSDGIITGARFDVIQNVGGWPKFGADLPRFTQRMASGPYRIPRMEFRWRAVTTSTTPIHAYRGAGRPEATLSLERAVDELAATLGIDPAEIRRLNFFPPQDFPVTTITGERYDSGNYEAALDLALSKLDYRGLREEQESRRRGGDRHQLGIGIATYVEVTAPANRKDWGSVEIHSDGSATVISGASSHGQGHETTFPQIVSERLRIPIDRITLVQGDTDTVVLGRGTMGSRSLQMAGSAILRSADIVLDRARHLVSEHMEARLEDIILTEEGALGVVGSPGTTMTWAEVATLTERLAADDIYSQEHATVSFGTHISVVEVDTATGDVRLVGHVACDDAGHILNRMVLDGQVHGGIVQGIGQALFEQVRYDSEANPLTTNLTSYLLPTASLLPSFVIDHTVTRSSENPLGVKGIGEAGTIGATPAVFNAVADAIRHLGVDDLQMPLTAERVWSSISRSSA